MWYLDRKHVTLGDVEQMIGYEYLKSLRWEIHGEVNCALWISRIISLLHTKITCKGDHKEHALWRSTCRGSCYVINSPDISISIGRDVM